MPTAVVGNRSDARRNHARLLAAARAVFGADGPHASLAEIARQAGVGIGTLYRHFPSRQELVAALFEDESAKWHAVGRTALGLDDAAGALRYYFDQLLALQAGNRWLHIVLRERPESELAESQAEMVRLTEALLERVRAAGVVRPDFTLADLAAMFWSFEALLEVTADIAPGAWRRQLGFVLDGLRPAAATAAAAPPLTAAELERASERMMVR
ncbi:MAG: TetR/AcrR family transcriptional regulator [Gaiellaceae bacterium]